MTYEPVFLLFNHMSTLDVTLGAYGLPPSALSSVLVSCFIKLPCAFVDLGMLEKAEH